MSGYREHSFDPNAGGNSGRPLRPYNWVQWIGVGCGVVGIAIILAYFAGRIGWLPKLIDSPTVGTAFTFFAIPLINSRREQVSAEQFARTRRRSLIAVAVALVIFAVMMTAILVFKGA